MRAEFDRMKDLLNVSDDEYRARLATRMRRVFRACAAKVYVKLP